MRESALNGWVSQGHTEDANSLITGAGRYSIVTGFGLREAHVKLDAFHRKSMGVVASHIDELGPCLRLICQLPDHEASGLESNHHMVGSVNQVGEEIDRSTRRGRVCWELAMRATDLLTLGSGTMPHLHCLLLFTRACGKQAVVVGPCDAPNDSRVSIFDLLGQAKVE